MTSGNALHAVSVCAGIALFLQSLELRSLRAPLSPRGTLGWDLIREDFASLPRSLRAGLDALYSERGFSILTGALMLGSLLLCLPHPPMFLPSALFLGVLLCSSRFRGNFNGGADSMTLVVFSALAVAAWFPERESVARGALFYIAIQSALSYFVAGFAKVRQAEWRSGRAFTGYFSDSMYDIPVGVRRLAAQPAFAFSSAWLVMLTELGLPIVFLGVPKLAPIWLGLGALFHLLNFGVLGLNRFFWIWLATYPALFFCASLLST